VNGFGVGGPTHGRLGRLQTLSFGGLTLHDLVGDYPAQGEGGYDLPFFGANVGGGVWKRFTMTCAGAGSTCFVANSIWPNRWWSIIGVPLSIAAIVAFFIK
jgi:hypothetical protein